MMTTEMTSAEQDEAAVTAVKRGDVERYRELVERHERRVFAVAWSCLGDAALAEEVTQEAFIRGYRRLWLIGDGAKFAGWMSTIARRLAINFGLRHRRELNRRERWALENYSPPGEDHSSDATDPLPTPETLRQTLAQLPAAHRECLVLFYLEGKSGAEAAAALGISEAALRVRLHRARAAMRERLEAQLEGSLARLGPAKTLVPAIMAGVLASSSAKAAAGGAGVAIGTGAKILSAAGKLSLFTWFVPLMSLMTLPGLGFAALVGRMERRNFREAEGFRPKLHWQFFRSFAWGFPLLLVAVTVGSYATLVLGGVHVQQSAFACLMLALMLIQARSLTICRNAFQMAMFAYGVIIAAGLSALALGWMPSSLGSLPLLAATLLFMVFHKQRPARMDYNLFLRAAHGQMIFSGPVTSFPPVGHFDRRALLAFARFLGSRFLVNNFHWETSGLVLRTPPVGNRFLTNMASAFLPPISQHCSHIALGHDGTVLAHCGETDAHDLSALKTGGMTDPRELEEVVAGVAGQAWREFCQGNPAQAERTLGELPESEIFLVPPRQAKSNRWWRVYFGVALMVMAVPWGLTLWRPVWFSGLKPVAVTETEVRAFLNDTAPNPDPKFSKFNSPTRALFNLNYFVLPTTNLFSPAGLQAMRDEIARGCGFASWRQSQWPVQRFVNGTEVRLAFVAGWIDCEDMGLKPAEITEYLHQNQPASEFLFKTKYLLTNERAWSWVDSQAWDVQRAGYFTLVQLRWLQRLNCLDLVDRENLIRQIVSVQDLSATPAPGQPKLHDWRDVRGLFFTPCYPALQDTYFALASLEILGGLNQLDREACIRGILRRHEGRGFFSSPDSGSFNEYHIDGSAPDTIAAFESLRILGALDRVKDLAQWQFRVAARHSSQPDAQGVRALTWDEVQAWICQQRLANILRGREENPRAPVRSLLEP
jgi:RNA polymerase sigma-70 factor (ECF subfamily)